MPSMIFRMCSLPMRAFSKASVSMAVDIPSIFRSIWTAVTPFMVPAILKSISPR
ncbi:MAG: hypothetical protein BWX47_01961 [candidate division Hyd24-12 bacterium ADurb.Bin004]|nr:MAG: hypothetical protein BWX47_01961 [candidate division Hyd24-12 bacterium ADurb.Bin004]